MTIKEVAEKYDISADTLRYYEGQMESETIRNQTWDGQNQPFV